MTEMENPKNIQLNPSTLVASCTLAENHNYVSPKSAGIAPQCAAEPPDGSRPTTLVRLPLLGGGGEAGGQPTFSWV